MYSKALKLTCFKYKILSPMYPLKAYILGLVRANKLYRIIVMKLQKKFKGGVKKRFIFKHNIYQDAATMRLEDVFLKNAS